MIQVSIPQVLGYSSLRLVVETEFSANARCVWVDPHLLIAPLPHGFVPPSVPPESGAQVRRLLRWKGGMAACVLIAGLAFVFDVKPTDSHMDMKEEELKRHIVNTTCSTFQLRLRM